ncbi:heterodisulfide reductase subunit C [Desulfitispora alkaliphila]|uniref:4Fe-4S dicluster domain-containing protein n=1 Tax=Desulfitispora alkaliphila TaxID=622674 RepID=UPI003D1C23D4
MERVNLTAEKEKGKDFVTAVEAESGVTVNECYQCGKCSAGCPVAFAMDYTPRQIIRMLQLGMKDDVLKSETIWLCAHCETCYTRCPKSIELAKLMETLRIKAKGAGFITEKNIDIFTDQFLKSVEKYGRVHEMGLIMNFNIRSGQLFKDAGLGPVMMQKGKIHIAPSKVRDTESIKRIFEKSVELGGEL